MTEISERRLTHDELRTIAFECATCHAGLTIDLANLKQTDRFRVDGLDTVAAFPCPFCGTPFDISLRQAVASFCDFLMHLGRAHPKQPAVFRIPIKGAGG